MKVLIYLYLLLSFATSCQPKQNMIYMSNHHFEDEVSQARYTGLHIQTGDVLDIVVSAMDDIAVRPFNRTTMTQTANADTPVITGAQKLGDNQYQVNTDGTISFPILGSIYCKGMTNRQLKSAIEDLLKTYLTDPVVTIKLSNFNISVLGEVANPGQKTSPNERLNLFQALALAGDMSSNADRTQVKLVRYNEESQKDMVVNLDLSDAGIVSSPYYYLQQNDVLYVQPDKNAQIAATASNPNRGLMFQIGAALIGVATIIIALTK